MSRPRGSLARASARSLATLVLAAFVVAILAAPAHARMEISISPSSGPVGTKITVKGTDYGADTVEIYWEGDDGKFVLQGTATVRDDRGFTFTFDAPQGKAGSHKVKVTPKGSTNPNNDRTRPFKITTGGKAVEVRAGCVGVDHGDEDSDLLMAASMDGAPQGASFQMRFQTPEGQTLLIRSSVDDTGRVEGEGKIFVFGPYVVQGPISIAFTDPNTGEQVRARVDPTGVVPGGVFIVGPEEVACDAADLPPGTLLVFTASPTTVTEAPEPGEPPPGRPSPPAEGGGLPVVWILVIGGGVLLIGVGGYVVVVGGKGEQPDLVHPGWDEAPPSPVDQPVLPEPEVFGGDGPRPPKTTR